MWVWAACLGVGPPTVWRTVDPSPDELTLAVIGDWGQDRAGLDGTAAALKVARRDLGVDLLLLTGDNAYPRGLTGDAAVTRHALRFQRLVGDDPPATWAVAGNHDWGRGFDAAAFGRQRDWAWGAGRYHLPSQDWVLDLPLARIVGLETTRRFWDGADDSFIDAALAGADTRWRVVLAHHTFMSNGTHGTAGAYEGWRGVPWMSGTGLAALRDTSLCGCADIVLSGHDHHREWLDACGTWFAVSGAGADPHGPPGRGIPSLHSSGGHGLVHLTLTASTIEVRFVDPTGVSWQWAAPRRPRVCGGGPVASETRQGGG